MLLSESDRRRPGFLPGASIVLADGQTWTLRRPVVVFEPDESDDGFRVTLSVEGVDNYSDLMEAWRAAKADAEYFKAEFALAKALLLANYDLQPADLSRLLKFGYKGYHCDPRHAEIREQVMEVAQGRDPKPSDDGDAS